MSGSFPVSALITEREGKRDIGKKEWLLFSYIEYTTPLYTLHNYTPQQSKLFAHHYHHIGRRGLSPNNLQKLPNQLLSLPHCMS